MSTALTREVQPVGLQTMSKYRIKRPFWSFFERTFRVFTMDGQLTMFVRHPLLKLREEFMVYADEAQQQPLLRIKARQMIAINFSFDITDALTGQLLGTVEKRGLRSLFRDKFLIMDAVGTEIGYAEEQGAALLRRMFPLLTSKHAIFMHGAQAGFVRQIFRFFTKEFEVEVAPSAADPRFVLAVALLALMQEARREDKR
jgi:hypothetical protein